MKRFCLCRTSFAAASAVALAVASSDAAEFSVINTNNSGDGSLNQAIINCETTAGDDTITFDLPGPGPHIIELTSELQRLGSNIAILNDRPGDEAVTVKRNTGGPNFRIFTTESDTTVLIAGLTISSGKVSGSNGNAGAGGGILHAGAMLTLRHCVLSANIASIGGGVYNEGQNLSFQNCTFDTNFASLPGGGIFNNTGAVSFRDCTFTGNVSDSSGGGIWNEGEGVTLSNCTLSGNSSTHFGGAIALSGGTNSIVNCTFSGNSANNGGALHAQGDTEIGNNIFKRGGTGGNVSAAGGLTSTGHNLCDDAAGGDTGTAPGGFLTGSEDQRNTDPKLGPLGPNGGPTLTCPLLPDSPAIDAGNDAVLGPPLDLTTDQRGFPRRIGLHVDIGAYERDPPQSGALIVNTIADHDDGTCGLVDCALREAVSAINATFQQPGVIGSINFAPGLSGTISLTSALPTVSKNVEIAGPGANVLTVRRDTGGNYRIFDLSNGTASGPQVVLIGLTLSNGQGTGSGTPGGCIYNDRGGLRLQECVVTGNNGGNGAGIYNDAGAIVVTESTVSANSATGFGGGIFNSAFQGPATLTVSNSTISGNSAGGRGAAIHNDGSSANIAKVTLENSTLSGNSAFLGGIFNNGANGKVTLRNTILKTGATGGNFVNANGASVTSEGHNLSSDSAGGDAETGPGGLLNGTGDIRNTDPKFDPAGLVDNGGSTPTVALLSDSAAIDAGNDASAPPADQRGYLRVGVTDIGAFEFGGAPPPTPTPTPTPTPIPTATPTPIQTTLANISTRLRVETGDNVLIGGFIITGTQAKKIIVRGIGTSLPFVDKLANPTLELRDSAGGLIESNDNWVDSPNKQAIIDSTIPPSNDLESAIVATLGANNSSYTAIVRGVEDGTGIGVVEAYDLDTSVDSKLANISTRGLVQTGDNVLIAGTIVVGQAAQKVIVRAIGPSLPVPGKLGDPTLELRDANGTLLAENDNWRTGGQEAEIIATTIPPTNDFESAIVATLPANNASYTAIVRGVNDTTGIAVVEVYALN